MEYYKVFHGSTKNLKRIMLTLIVSRKALGEWLKITCNSKRNKEIELDKSCRGIHIIIIYGN